MENHQQCIQAVLNERCAAIASKDLAAFQKTQLQEIPGSTSEGYMLVDTLRAEALSVHVDQEDPTLILSLVLETYLHGGTPSHRGYLLYFFRRFNDGTYKVADICWSSRSMEAE